MPDKKYRGPRRFSPQSQRTAQNTFSALAVAPSVALVDQAGNKATLSTGPAGTEFGLLTRNIPSGTQVISGTVAQGAAAVTSSAWPIKVTDGTNSASILASAPSSDTGQAAIAVRIVSQLGAGTGGGYGADKSAFTEGATTFSSDGGVYNDSLVGLSSGVQAEGRITQFRALHMNLRDSSGVEIASTLVSSAKALNVNVVQSVGSAAPSAQDNTASNFTAGTSLITPIGGVFNDSLTAVTSTQAGGFRMTAYRSLHAHLRDLNGNAIASALIGGSYAINCNVVQNTAAQVDQLTFGAGSTVFGLDGGVYNDSLSPLTSGMGGAARMTQYRGGHVNLRTSLGAEIGIAASPVYNSHVSANGQRAIVDSQGYLQVRERSSVLFYDSMPTATLDANRWSTVLSSGTVVQSAESIAVAVPATASAYAQIFSTIALSPQGSQDVVMDGLVFLPSAAANGPTFFFGFGNKQATPTSAIPVLDGIGFSCGANSNINGTIASIYANGVLKNSSVVTSLAVLNAWNRYRITWSGVAAYFYLNDMDTPVASLTGALPVAAGFTSNAMSALFVAVAPTTTAAAGTMKVGPLHVGDMGRNNLQISDGTYPWRQLTISNYTSGTAVYGQMVTVEQKDTNRTNFSAYNAGVAPTTTLSLVTLTQQRGGVAGSSVTSIQPTAGKTLRIVAVELSIMNTTTISSSCRIMLHMSNTGAVTTASPIIGNCACNTANSTVANYCDSAIIALPDGVEFTGNMQFGVSIQGIATGAAYITINGMEY